MAGKYDDLARAILENVGGKENVNSVAHCITRVRFKLKDEGKANTEAIEKLEGVIKVMQANGQYQVVVGNKVEDVYDAVVAVGGLVAGGEIDAEDDAPKGIAAKAIDLISGIFAPMLGTFAAAGIMRASLPPSLSSSLSSPTMALTPFCTPSPTACSISCRSFWRTPPPRSSG